jgi:hypothetical protein
MSFIIVSSLACATAERLVPKFAEAAVMVCDKLEEYDHFASSVKVVKDLVEEGDYVAALSHAKALYVEYQNKPETEGLNELRTLLNLLENLV